MTGTTALSGEGSCPYCSKPPYSYVYHTGTCPKIKAVEYYPDGTVKRIEYKD